MPTRSTSSKIVPVEGLTFDDVLLLPGYAEKAREQVNPASKIHPKLQLRIPLISSPMDTVTETEMAIAMASSGGLGIIHRNLQISKEAEMVRGVKSAKVVDATKAAVDAKGRLLVGAAVGAGADLEERVRALVDAEADVLVVDSGHGHSKYIIDAVKFIKKKYPKMPVMAGNVATAEGAKALIKAGADMLRVGVGPGSICTTRVVTGVGVPQIAALLEAVKAAKGSKTTIIADGGIRQMGDIAKALACGAQAVILGSLLAGHDEAPGEMVENDGKKYKQYRGMGSIGAMQKGGAERYGQSMKTEAKKLIAEGVEGLVPYRGKVSDFLFQAIGALRSSLYYVGAADMAQFHAKSRFVRITQASLMESHPHSIKISSAGSSYMR
jgi:IMP dehydrogenase